MTSTSTTEQLPYSADHSDEVFYGILIVGVVIFSAAGSILTILYLFQRRNNSVSHRCSECIECIKENTTEDIFDKSWDFKTPISLKDEIIDINDTGVRLNFKNYSNNPEEEGQQYVFCSVHDNFTLLAPKIKVKKDQMLVSPGVEVTLSSKKKFTGYVTIEIPMCKMETVESIRVHWVATPLTSTPTTRDIPFEKDPSSSRLDCFYTWSDNDNVLVYTKHFSLFYCWCFKSAVRFELSAQICARVGQINGFPTLQIKFKILGMQNKLKKRQKNEHNGFHVVESGEIKLLENQNSKKKRGFLKCRIETLLRDNCPGWQHVTREGNQEQVYPTEQDVDIAELIKSWQRHHELCYCISWYMRCEMRSCHRLPIVVDVNNSSRDGKSHQKTTFTTEVDVSTAPVQDKSDVSSERESEEAEVTSHTYDKISLLSRETALSQKLRLTRLNRGRGKREGHENGGFSYISPNHENQRQIPEMMYDSPEYRSSGSSYASMKGHVNGLNRKAEQARTSPYEMRTRKQNLPAGHINILPINSSSSNTPNCETSDDSVTCSTSSPPTSYSESTSYHEPVSSHEPVSYPDPMIYSEETEYQQRQEPLRRPRTIGASMDQEETNIKERVDFEQTLAKSPVSDSISNSDHDVVAFV
ncbi:uncharacterized protein [Argopecten irradians]|uniref:uncharacterized protein n=1 Tax=Argopecten irradians TaxID=31199 RepID=UPI0037202FB1